MDIKRWTDDLSVENDVLDGHHKRLFDLLGDVTRVVDRDGGLHEVVTLFQALNDYIGYHFRTEEAMMEVADFPFLELHRHSHQTIAMRVQDMADSLTEANHAAVARELGQFLSGWLVHHIEIEDFEYRPYVGGQGGAGH